MSCYVTTVISMSCYITICIFDILLHNQSLKKNFWYWYLQKVTFIFYCRRKVRLCIFSCRNAYIIVSNLTSTVTIPIKKLYSEQCTVAIPQNRQCWDNTCPVTIIHSIHFKYFKCPVTISKPIEQRVYSYDTTKASLK